MSNIVSANQLGNYVGQEISISEWIHVEQDRIDLFADATGDHQYIHVDAERAAETPSDFCSNFNWIQKSHFVQSVVYSHNGVLKLDPAVH